MSVSSLKIHVGMDVHKDTVMMAVLPESAEEPTIVKQLPNDERVLRRFLDRIAKDGELHCSYEASGAGYVLHRAIEAWGHRCEVIAPALIPTRPGRRRKHDRFDAIELAKQHRAGLLVAVRIPSEAEERVRDLVRCRETFQREILKSRHYILKFLRRRGFVFRDGSNWTQKHLHWIRSLLSPGELVAEDRDARAAAPSPRPATVTADTSSSRPPGATDIRHGWEPGSGTARRDSHPRWWPTAGRLGIDCTNFRRIEERRGSRTAVVALGRELTGFVWAVLQDVDSKADLQQETAA